MRWGRYLGAAVLALVANPLSAAVVTLDLNVVFTGGTPAGPAPYISATFDDSIGGGQVRLTMSALNLASSEFVTQWLFNLDPSLDADLLTFTQVSSDAVVDSAAGGNDAFHTASNNFDLEFQFAMSNSGGGANRFKDGETVVYDLGYTGAGTLDAFSFEAANLDDGLLSLAHVQGLANGGSSKVADDTPPDDPPGGGSNPQVPEPASLVAWSLLGLAAIFARGKRPIR